MKNSKRPGAGKDHDGSSPRRSWTITREQVVRFMLGISVGTAIGYFLRPEDPADEERWRISSARTGKQIGDTGTPQDRQDVASSLSHFIPTVIATGLHL